MDLAPNIPGVLYFAFQMMFALMVPVIVTGSGAEKLAFCGFLIFVTVWCVGASDISSCTPAIHINVPC